MQTDLLTIDSHELQKTFLTENKIFLEAIRKKSPLDEILRQYEKVQTLFKTIKEKHNHLLEN